MEHLHAYILAILFFQTLMTFQTLFLGRDPVFLLDLRFSLKTLIPREQRKSSV